MTQLFSDKDTLTFLIVGVAIALFLITQTMMKLWPFLSKLVTMVNGFVGYDGEPGVLDRIKTLEHNSDAEQTNHNKMSDQLDRVEAQVHALGDRLDEFAVESTTDRNKLWDIARTHHRGEIEE